jgi:hypothetical protein
LVNRFLIAIVWITQPFRQMPIQSFHFIKKQGRYQQIFFLKFSGLVSSVGVTQTRERTGRLVKPVALCNRLEKPESIHLYLVRKRGIIPSFFRDHRILPDYGIRSQIVPGRERDVVRAGGLVGVCWVLLGRCRTVAKVPLPFRGAGIRSIGEG